jgi:hydroxymethylpyrimidine pyrophosphatase-like HAD family hydrolase
MKKPIVFDLDGTLADGKSSIDVEMARLFDSLLAVVRTAVFSLGGPR